MLTAGVTAPARIAAQPVDVCDRINELARAQEEITLGVVLIDLETGDRCDMNGSRPFRSASLYKNVVLAELFRQVDEGLLALDDPLVVEPRHAEDDPPTLRITQPFTTTMGEAARLMITVSSNPAAVALVERLGILHVNAAVSWLEMPDTVIDPLYVTTPNDQARFFEQLYHGEIVDTGASEQMVEMYLGQVVTDMFRRAIPIEVPIAHKTGTLLGYLHDAGIVYAPGGDFVLIALTEHGAFESAMIVLQDVAATAYEAFATERAPGERIIAATPTPVPAPEPLVTPVATTPAAVSGAPLGEDVVREGAEAPVDPAIDSTITLGDPAGQVWGEPLVWGLSAAVMMLVLAVSVTAVVARRRSAHRYGRLAAERAALIAHVERIERAVQVERIERAERGMVMRFVNRRDDAHDEAPDEAPVEAYEEAEVAIQGPQSQSITQVAELPVMPSRRLQRVAEHFHSQSELLTSMREQFEQEMEPLHDLLVRQNEAMRRLLGNLEERLRPLNEYADGEEANLDALEHRIQDGGSEHIARSFAEYLADQRVRIAETREQIDAQRIPFVQYDEDQRDAVEVALARFDDDIAALEENLAEQRRVMLRMLDALRSETFVAVRDYLSNRVEMLTTLAASGSSDPVAINQELQQLRRQVEGAAGGSDHVRSVLNRTDAADAQLASFTGDTGGPRALPADEPPAAEEQAGDDLAEAEAAEVEEASTGA
jgi:beta-lactamase class A